MLDACTHFTYTILMKKSNKETVHFCFSISRKMPITSHIFVPLLVHLFDVMQWHMYNVITITRRNNVCDNSLYLYYAAVCLCHKIVTIMLQIMIIFLYNVICIQKCFTICVRWNWDLCVVIIIILIIVGLFLFNE